MFASEHLVRQINHFIVHLYAQCLAQVGETIEEVRVASFEKDRYDVPLTLDCFLDKRLFPFDVLYLSILFA